MRCVIIDLAGLVSCLCCGCDVAFGCGVVWCSVVCSIHYVLCMYAANGYITDKLIRREGNYMILKESWYDHTVYGMWYVVCGM